MQAKLVHKRVTLSRTTQLRLLCQYCALYCQSAKPKHQWNKSCWILPWAIHHTECITKQTQLCVQGAPNVGDHIENKDAFSISRSNLINHLSKLANILIKMSKSVFHHVNPLYKKSDFFHWNCNINKSRWTTWITKCWKFMSALLSLKQKMA